MTDSIPSFFRAYDVRGIYGSDITEKVAYRMGNALCSYLGEGSTINVARDTRRGSEELSVALTLGILDSGCSVIDVGRIPSPLLYYSTSKLESLAGVMVTASHLPPQWNGFKFCDISGQVISEGHGLEKISHIYAEDEFRFEKKGKVSLINGVIDDYYETVKTSIKSIRTNFKVAVDTSNSVPSLVIPHLFQRFSIKSTFINDNVLFVPVHDVEPSAESMQMLSEEVVRNGSGLGIMYDSDGDRVAFVDEKGRIYPDGTVLIAIFSIIYSRLHANGSVVVDITCPSSLLRFMEGLGLEPLISRVGHNFCSSLALQKNSLFAAQFSGHISLMESQYRDDAIHASLRLIEFVSNLEEPLSKYIDRRIPHFFYDTAQVEVQENQKFKLMERLNHNLREKGEKILTTDGVKVLHEDGSYLIRLSNTSSIIRIMAEGKTSEVVKRMMAIAINETNRVINGD